MSTVDLGDVKRTLEDTFSKERAAGRKRGIVFWYDGQGEFAEDIASLDLADAQVVVLRHNNAFAIKHQIEVLEPEANFLVYSPCDKPAARDNWLFDTLSYSREFFTDKASLVMRELGIKGEHLKPVVQRYIKFFASKERRSKFASYEVEAWTEHRIDLCVMATLCRTIVPDFEQVLRKVLAGSLDANNRYLEAIDTFGDIDAFWRLVERHYGYAEADKSLSNLSVSLLVTHAQHSLEVPLPKTWQSFVLPKAADCVVFVSNYINHAVDGETYVRIADSVERTIRLDDYLQKWDINQYLQCDTFRGFDGKILATITKALVEGLSDFATYRKILAARKPSQWHEHFANEYSAVHWALSLLEHAKTMGQAARGDSAFDIVQHYIGIGFQADQFYRKFYTSFDAIASKDGYAALAETVENTYCAWFLNDSAVRWSQLVTSSMLDEYRVPGLQQQQQFYKNHVAPFLRKDERVFVVISDALRYEVGEELARLLNGEMRGMAELDFMQGVVPSTTKFGMASVLPHKKISVDEKQNVLIDGLSTQGTANRENILRAYHKDAVSIQYDHLIDMKRTDYKETFDGKKLIYIYHNGIDAIGDDASTERKVFQAAQQSLDELLALVRDLVSHLSATNIIIISDHGFVYRRSPLAEIDKVSRQGLEPLETGRRHMLVKGLPDADDCLAISMKYLLGEDTKLRALVPGGTARFKIQGPGANFVHGGVSLQEIVLPIVKFKYIRKDKFKPTKVEVGFASISRKITNRITYLEFFQTESVDDKRLPLRLKIYFEDEQGARISNENIVIADSKSKDPKERSYREKFTLKDMPYSKTRDYYLILEDEDESVEKIYAKIAVGIDLLITNDFS